MDFKDTLLLPKTDFPMRGNLPTNEPKKYNAWYATDIYEQMKSKREGAEMFTLHDGPPYANGDIHIGHALNKTLKDIILKYNYFQGKAVRMTPGWDCHGLPIEQKVEEKLGKSKKEAMPTAQFRELCRAHAAKFVDIQRDSFKELGIIADWENPYVTMDFKFEANIYRTLCEVAKKGLLVERHKPIFWSWAARTALADAEVEYEDKEDYSIYVHFELSDAAKEKLGLEDKAGLVIWTTTPWTLPSNTGISLNPEEMYVLTDDGHIVAEARYDAMIEEGVVSGHASRKIAATEMENLLAINPVNGRTSTVVLGDHVLMDGGTGCVHTAPGHGEDDYKVGLKYGLEVVMPVDERGCFDESVVGLNLLPNPEEFVGMHIFKANEPILEILGDSLLKESKFVHSYPHCWRTKKPLIYRATNQWFIAMDEKLDLISGDFVSEKCPKCQSELVYRKGPYGPEGFFIGCQSYLNNNLEKRCAYTRPINENDLLKARLEKKTLRQTALDVLDGNDSMNGVTFFPSSSKNRLKPMIEGRPDWCISRQRSWGVPIAFFRIKSTKEVIFDADVLEHIANLFDVHGADAWYAMSNAELLPADTKYKPDDLEKISDILDVWFDSGSTWNSVLSSGNYDAGQYPASLYIEGSDQHRGWFQSSLLLSSAINQVSPYKTLITHGFTVDNKGEKMSKSKGNVVAPDKVIKQYGSEILRLWVALSDYQSDLKISDGILKQTAEQYRKIRNTFRFLLANVNDLEVYVDESKYGELDRWILLTAQNVFGSVKKNFDEYDFLRGFATLNHFITNELSGIYMDITKDRLYCEDKNDPARRATQSAMAHISKSMLGLIAPVLTYTADEILEYASPLFKDGMKDVFDLTYVEIPVKWNGNEEKYDYMSNDFYFDYEIEEKDGEQIRVQIWDGGTYAMKAREKFYEVVDKLKKEKIIKSTLELEISGDLSIHGLPSEPKDLEDWFVVSKVDLTSTGEEIATFEVGEIHLEKTDWTNEVDIPGHKFTVHKATAAKCPRCWKFTSKSEIDLCKRCGDVDGVIA